MGLKTEFIKLALSEMRDAIRCKRVFLYPRDENLYALTSLGITRNHAFDEMLSLSENDYYSGPDADWNHPNDSLWVFKKIICNEPIYIKFTMIDKGGEQNLIVISFHFNQT